MLDRPIRDRWHQFRTVDLFVGTLLAALTVIVAKQDHVFVLAGLLGAVASVLTSHSIRNGLVVGILFGIVGFQLAYTILSLGIRIADKPFVVAFVCCCGVIGGLLPAVLKRWRQSAPQFRMSILFVVAALLVSATGFTAARFQSIRKQNRIVANLESKGARIEYQDTNPYAMIIDSSRMGSRPKWIRKLLEMRVISRIFLTKHGENGITTPVNFGAVDSLRSMSLVSVLELELHADHFDDDEVVALLNSGQLSALKELRIRGRRFSDAALSRLQTNVFLLDLWGTSISDESVEHIATFPLLAVLDVRETDITETGLKRLKAKVGRVVSSK